MKQLFLILALIAALLLGACATLKPVDRISLLRAELDRWQNFSADGIIRISYSGLTLHKMFVLAKTSDSARLDILDGGAFGISPAPLISVYLADYLAVESPLLPQLESMAQALPDPSSYLALLADPDALVNQYGQELAAGQTLEFEGLRLNFTPQMKLEQVLDLSSGAELSVTYTSKGDPDKLLISLDKNTSVELLVDNISYGEAETQPLPRNDAPSDPEGLQKLLKESAVQP